MQHNAKILVVVVNNGMYGTIRMHQEREFPHRVYGTALRNPDFVALAKAYGLHAERVSDIDAFDDALERALAEPHSALLELIVDPEAISVRTTITALRERTQ
jgi:acetolactate synthase-1/2/3 large subunit